MLDCSSLDFKCLNDLRKFVFVCFQNLCNDRVILNVSQIKNLQKSYMKWKLV